ncbi:chitinase domain-containing protein 1 [Achlya hypogyna]|uniref:Chitinase domain-containing protein 1 n=1 Tax=Achlya hypogyna TaxID=1202772 RepID=A0A1V9YZ92_ACHHY|nr:chitinase domain-containing protein 1 [Achlya hypogyna]
MRIAAAIVCALGLLAGLGAGYDDFIFDDDMGEDNGGEVNCVVDDDAAVCHIPSVFDRGLVTASPTASSILKHANHFDGNTAIKRFSGETLGYVTPWNKHGYDTAKIFRKKFTYIAPVWYQIRHDAAKTPTLTGGHDVDSKWIDQVRGSDGDGPKIVPRFMFEMTSLTQREVTQIVKLLAQEVASHGYDGLTLEIPIVEITVPFLQALGKALHKARRLLLVVLPTSQRDGRLSVDGTFVTQLMPFVDRFSVNAYDYSSAGPNAPLPWLQATLRQLQPPSKFLMGLAFYGYDTNEAVIGPQYLELLSQHSPEIEWDAHAHECVFAYAGRRRVYYPCLRSVHERLEYFSGMGAGAAIWEIGQGLDYFFDLL